jgi:Bardet-Biedl syndrome 5 protein
LFTSFQTTIRSYDTTKLYRDFKIRAAIILDKELLLLPQEQVFHKFGGVWNISAEQGNLGTMYVTSIRIVWFANVAESFNVSLPYIQVKSIKKKDSHFGQALIIETSNTSGNYILGFRTERLEEITVELNRLFRVFVENPILGVESSVQEVQPPIEQVKQPRVFDDIDIVEAEFSGQANASAAYYVSSSKLEENIVFCPQLGLAIEKPPNNISIEHLWKLI